MERANGESLGVYVQIREKARRKGEKPGSKHLTLDWLTLGEARAVLTRTNVRARLHVQQLIREADDA